MQLVKLDEDIWLDYREVVAVHKNGSTVVDLRSGARLFPSLTVDEVLTQLRKYARLGEIHGL